MIPCMTIYSPQTSFAALPFVRRYLFVMATATVFLMAVGSATRVMNAGLACPDWPLCYGVLVPSAQMNLQVFLEWFHRVIATSMGVAVLGLVGCVVYWRQELPRWLVPGAVMALLIVVTQGILGGLTVTQMLRFDIVTAHLGTGLLFFGVLLGLAIALSDIEPQAVSKRTAQLQRWTAPIAMGVVYGQSLLGGLVASQWALHYCFGANELCHVMAAHLIGIAPASLAVLVAAVIAIATSTGLYRRLGWLALGLLIAQLAIGYATFRLRLAVEPLTVTHQVVGALLLGCLVVMTLVAWRQPTLAKA